MGVRCMVLIRTFIKLNAELVLDEEFLGEVVLVELRIDDIPQR